MFSIKNITKKPIFWIIFVALSIACTLFSLKYFSKAMPIVNIDIKMDRTQALEQASKLAQKFGWGPKEYKQATSFKVDQATKVFVELDCDGQKAFVQMMKDKLYMPYQWGIRHFKPFEQNETYIQFTHEGKPYGFREVISENTPGAALDPQKAQEIAEKEAKTNWKINFDVYKLVEPSKEITPSKRVDHTFVYERKNRTIGKGFYRLKLVVSGDKLTELNHFVKIPESFLDKYKEMRAANNLIAYIASFLLMLLYLLGGCVVGLFFLAKKRYVTWKTPVIVGSIIALLFFVNKINVIPSVWMGYNTVSSPQNFMFSYLISSFMFFLSKLFLFALSFMAAESLTRKAFGNHIQFWKLWSKKNASSTAVAGRTVGGYLLAPFLLAYVVATYLFTTKVLGWWMPSSELVNPNILSHYFPWLSSFTLSLGAGFWEECLFRAVPLSCAALIGKRYGKKHWWIAFAFVLQAVIFGAAHANYPAQPAYARLVELILPSFMFAGVYLSFGLLPSIITHFFYDLILMSLPLFVSSSAHAWVNQTIVIALGLIPLIIVLIARLRSGTWSTITTDTLNKSWEPPEKVVKEEKPQIIIQKQFSLTPLATILFTIAGLLGTAAWVSFTPFGHNAKSFSISQQKAVTLAKKELQKMGIPIDKTWTVLPILAGKIDFTYKKKYSAIKAPKPSRKPSRLFQHRFIWQQDKNLYKKLLGNYLNEPQWLVRFVKFSGKRDQRAEEYVACLNTDKKLYRLYHKVPEDRKDSRLSQNEARVIAHGHLVQNFKLNPKELQEIGAKAKKLKNRTNWKFIYANKKTFPLKQGQARIVIKIDGNDVSDAYRYIHVPETWVRHEKNTMSKRSILMTICLLLTLFIIILTIILSGKLISGFSKKYAIIGFITYFACSMLIAANSHLQLITHFDPIKPFYSQLLQILGSLFISTLFMASLFGIVIGLIINIKTSQVLSKNSFSIIAAYSVGIAAIGIYTLILLHRPSLQPTWPDFSNIAARLPSINLILGNAIKYIFRTALVILFATALTYIYYNWRARYLAITLLCIASSFAANGVFGIDSITFWIIKSILLAIVSLVLYFSFIRKDIATIPLITAAIMGINIMHQALFNAYPYVLITSIVSVLIILFLSALWFLRLNQLSPAPSTGG